MRFRHRDGSLVHLAYCTHVHAAETLDSVTAQLDACAARVRDRLGTPVLGVGLWLARDAARDLAARPYEVARLRAHLHRRGLEVVTLNTFPYQGFHQPVVKHAVYTPDWTDSRRAAYTLDCARVLAGLLPDDVAKSGTCPRVVVPTTVGRCRVALPVCLSRRAHVHHARASTPAAASLTGEFAMAQPSPGAHGR
ncbi:hypothetical protein G3I56_30530 [Streptomyces sp. SID12488]|nr:hypothetical protein [Streptomyces sp. SID12488]